MTEEVGDSRSEELTGTELNVRVGPMSIERLEKSKVSVAEGVIDVRVATDTGVLGRVGEPDGSGTDVMTTDVLDLAWNGADVAVTSGNAKLLVLIDCALSRGLLVRATSRMEYGRVTKLKNITFNCYVITARD